MNTGQLTLDYAPHASQQPLVICYGAGRDSTALLVGLRQRQIRPDLILFADVGAERQSTYDYLIVTNAWLRSVGFPEITIVRYQPKDFKHWPPYHSIEENILTNCALPSIAYGFHKCSAKWKIAPQLAFLKKWQPARDCWASGGRVRKAIGFDASPREKRRSHGCSTYAVQDEEADLFDLWFPLQEWGWDLAECIRQIVKAGLPIPTKSSCYFCTAMKPHEVDDLAKTEPDKLKRIVVLEARARQTHLDYAERKGWPKGLGVPLTEGIWRRRVKGLRRGSTPKPGSITEYIREKQLLPEHEINRLIEATPTHPLSRNEIQDWQQWLRSITSAGDLADAA
ncbi:MAG: hypothetical protein SFY81_02760 [Verrucomicrobiota bacterium]|nr:hypothetical protein [Verrucomicrobiota bacterium]